MKVTINTGMCAGCNMCGAISGGVISVGATGKAELSAGVDLTNASVIEAIKMTAQACPSQAIVISETDA